MAAYNSDGRVPLVIWAATVDPADVPMMTSASVSSIACRPRAGENQGSLGGFVRLSSRLSFGIDLLAGHRPISLPGRSCHHEAIGNGRRANARS
jgi:hypothetical protein